MNPPLLKGGQGRTSRSVRDDGIAVAILFALFLVLLACLLAKAGK